MIVLNLDEATKINNSIGYMSGDSIVYNYSTDEAVLLSDISLDELLSDLDAHHEKEFEKRGHLRLPNVNKGFVHPSCLNLRALGATSTKQLVQFAIDLIAESQQQQTQIAADLRAIKRLIGEGIIPKDLDSFKERRLYKLLMVMRPHFSFATDEFDFGDMVSIDEAVVEKYLASPQASTTFNKQLFHIIALFKYFLVYCAAKRILLLPAYNSLPFLGFKASHVVDYLEQQVIYDIFDEFKVAEKGLHSTTKSADAKKAQLQDWRSSVARLVSCSTVTSIADLPYQLVLEVNQNRYADKDYISSSGSISKGLSSLIVELERTEWWNKRSDFTPVDLSLLKVDSAKRILSHDTDRDSAMLGYAEGKIDEPLRLQLSKHCQNLSGYKVRQAGVFVDYLIYLEENGQGVRNLTDLNYLHFSDELGVSKVKSFSAFFLQEKGDLSVASKHAHWNVAKTLYERCLRDEDAKTGNVHERCMASASTMFGRTKANTNVTVRASMPTILHELCLEILTKDDYAFARNFSKSQIVNHQYNYETGEHDENVFHPNVAYVTHLLLIFPSRSHQFLWLDEGLMDELIYDHDSGEFVENDHPMRKKAFITRYADDKTHAEKFPMQGFVIPDETEEGQIGLHFTRNKTKQITLQRTGNTGYQVPWVKDSGIEHLDDVLNIVKKQKVFNNKYSPRDLIPVNPMDQDKAKYNKDVYAKLPMGVPLFRDLKNPTISDFNPEKTNIYLPLSAQLVRNLFYALLDEVDREFQKRFETKRSVVRNSKGEYTYDLHALRVFGITNLLSKGVDPSIVQMLVGHATEIMTRYYKKLTNEQFRQIVVDAKKNAGQAPKSIREFIEQHADENLIALFDLLPEWSEHTSMRPDFALGGKPTRMRGGVCSQFDCNTGGLEIDVLNMNKEVVKITPIKAGAMSCGNCRYWRSAPELLADQIYYINLLGEEIHELAKEHRELVIKSQNVLFDKNLDKQAAKLASENYSKKAEEAMEKAIYKIVEKNNRELMLDECVKRLGEKTSAQVPVLAVDCYEHETNVSEVERCMELLLQATAHGIEQEDSVNMKKVQKFMTKLYAATNNENPFTFMPSGELKQLAYVTKMFEARSLLGDMSDEEFEDPRLLLQSFDGTQLKQLNYVLKEDTALLLTVKD